MRLGASLWGAVVLLAVLAGLEPARAGELWRTDDGVWSLEGSGFYKPYGAWLVMPRGLVEGLGALQSVLDETRPLLPPEAAASLPQDVGVPWQATMGSHTVRLSGRLLWAERLELAAAWQASAVMGSHPSVAVGGTTSSLLGGGLTAARRRLWDVEPLLVNEPGLRLQHGVELLSLKYQTPGATLVVGRQVLSWGTGRLWNPTDLLSPFAPTDVDREVRRGVDALRLSLPLGAVSQLELLWLPQQVVADNGGVVRALTNVGGFDLSLSLAKYVRDVVVGGDFSGDVGALGVHGEAAWTLPLEGLEEGLAATRVRGDFVRAVAGVDFRPGEQWMVTAEYYFNGHGASRVEEYAARLRDERVVRGEVFGAGRHYGGLVVSWLADDLLTVQMTALANLTDPSVMVVPALEYWFEQRVLIRAGGYLPLGARPDADVFRRLTPADVLGGSTAWAEAVSGFGLRSEYGATPSGFFAQVGIYFP